MELTATPNVDQAIAKAEFPVKLEGLFKKSRYKVLYGGRGGAKSWGIARALLILRAPKKQMRILCAREFQISIKDSVHKLLCDQIEALGLLGFYEITQATIRGANGTEFAFIGLKNNPTNIKSFEGVDVCWVEEAQSSQPRILENP
jgi:phage terminase large subunit